VKRVILVCHHFVPYTPAVGGVARVWYLADFLARKGFLVTVLTSTGHDFGNIGFPPLHDNVQVCYVRDPVKEKMQSRVAAMQGVDVRGKANKKVLLILRGLVSKFVIPDFGMFALPAYCIALSRILKAERVSDVIISAPSHSLLLAAVFIRFLKGCDVKIIADYRDGWNVRATFSSRGRLGRAVSIFMERSVIKSIDVALFATRSMLNNTLSMFSELKDKNALLLLNGCPELFLSDVRPREGSSGVFRIGHFGVVNDLEGGYRNIVPVLDHFQALKNEGFKFVLELYGDLRLSKIDIASYDFVRICGSLSHADALQRMREMDCLLMYHLEREGCQEVITGKFFDYVSARVPIFCLSPLEMEGAQLIAAHDLGICADYDEFDQVRNAFRALYEGRFVIGEGDVQMFSREAQYSKLLPLLS